MHRFFIFEPIINNKITPSKELFHQLKRVLHFKKNELFIVISESKEYEANFDGKNINIIKKIDRVTKKQPKIILIQSLIKNSRLSFLLQKTTELGVDEIIFVQTSRSIPSLKNYFSKDDRIKKVLQEAAEQSNRITIPKVSYIPSLSDLNLALKSLKIFAYEDIKIGKKINLLFKSLTLCENDIIYIMVGPEGGWDQKELEFLREKFFDIKVVSISENILRSETAAILLVGIVNYEVNI